MLEYVHFHGITWYWYTLPVFLHIPVDYWMTKPHQMSFIELDMFLPVLYNHHVLLPTVSGTADIPHPTGFTGIITINKVL